MRKIVILAALATMGTAGDPQRIRLAVERQDASSKLPVWRAVNPATVFSSSDRLRFKITANFSGYLHVMNQGTSGAYEQLFPRSDTGANNRIEAGKEYVVPAAQGWFRPTGPAGQDIVYWVVTPVELTRAYRPLPPPPPKEEIPAGLRPRCDDAIFKARGECIDHSAGVKPVESGASLPDNLGGLGATPRELLFIQEKGGAVLSSPTPLTGPVVYELRLAHN